MSAARHLGRLVAIVLLVAACSGPALVESSDVEELAAFAEQEFGADLLVAVPVRFLSEESFVAGFGEAGPSLLSSDEERGLELLGLLDPAQNVQSMLRRSNEVAIVGLYDSLAGDITVRGGELDDLVRSTIVHEIVHALQDHHRPPSTVTSDGDHALAVRSLVEGDAVRIEDRWWEHTLGTRALDLPEVVDEEPAWRTLPAILRWRGEVPYVLGPLLAAHLEDSGQLDEAFARPPRSTLGLLDVELWDETPVAVDSGPVDGELLWWDRLGPGVLALQLSAAVDASTALDLARAWRGDEMVVWRGDDGRACARQVVTMSAAPAARRAAEALRGAAEGSTVRVERCSDDDAPAPPPSEVVDELYALILGEG